MTKNDQKHGEFLLALAVFSSGSAFKSVENKFFKMFINFLRPKFRIPSRFQVSTSLLKKIYKEVEKEVDSMIKKTKTVSLHGDRWSNIRSEGILNFVLSTPTPVFYKSVATGAASETGEFIAKK